MTSCRAAGGVVALLAAAAIVGCGSDSRPEADGPRLALGSGRQEFEAVAPDGSVPLIKGIQGGFHIWTSFLAYGFDTDVVRMDISTHWDEREDSLVPSAGNVSLKAATDPQGQPALVSLGWPAGIFKPTCANGRRVDIALTILERETGLTASTSARWVVDVAEEDRSSDCDELDPP